MPLLLVGPCLGMLAFAADLLPPPMAQVVTAAVSSGFGWGMAALVVAFFAPRVKSAILLSFGTLAAASGTYYLMILLVSRRWQYGVRDSADPGAASTDGLMAVGRAVGFWLVAAVVAGVVLGYLSHLIRWGSARWGTAAVGVAFGLLAGEGSYVLFHTAFVWVGPVDSFVWDRLHSALVQVGLAIVAFLVALRFRRQTISWPVLLVATVGSTTVALVLWHLVESARLRL